MSARSNERVAWFNGEFLPEREVRIPFRDTSWVYGDGCFDMTRTFGHRLFKVKEHVDRLYRSLKYLRIDPGFGPQKMCDLTEEVFERNRHLLGSDDEKANEFYKQFKDSETSKGSFAQELALLLETSSLNLQDVPEYIQRALQFLGVIPSGGSVGTTGTSNTNIVTDPAPN